MKKGSPSCLGVQGIQDQNLTEDLLHAKRSLELKERAEERAIEENMSHTLTIEVPDTIYKPLKRTAAQSGQSPEALVIQWLSLAVQQQTDDPLEQFIGALRGPGSAWADRHDQFLGQVVADTMQTTIPNNASDD